MMLKPLLQTVNNMMMLIGGIKHFQFDIDSQNIFKKKKYISH
jgi:hypothetical protein